MSAPAPGSDEWWTYLTGSKIAAVMGTSPYTSRFTLWHQMKGTAERPVTTAAMERGQFLEAAILDWWISKHPDHELSPGGWVEVDGRLAATPDAFAESLRDGEKSVIQAKTAGYSDGYGPDGTEGRESIPAGYYDQVQFEMYATGRPVAYLAVLFGMPFEFRSYRIERDDDRIRVLVQAANDFLASLDEDRPPSILTGSADTYQTIRDIHPEIDADETFKIPDAMAHAFLDARHERERHEEAESAAKHQILNAMGEAKRAVWVRETETHTLITRQARNGGKPYAVVARSLPSTKDAA